MKESSRVKYYLDNMGFFAHCALIMLALASVFRIIGCWGMWKDRVECIMLLVLPVFCCVLMALCILLLGKKGFFLSIIPVLLGVVFFVYKALYFDNWVQTVLCILLYLVIAVIYTATVFGWIHTKWLLPPLFGLPFLYHIIMVDIPALSNTAVPVSLADGMKEMSILGMMAALFCVSMALKKRDRKPFLKKEESAPAEETAPEPAPAPAPEVQPVSEKPAEPPVFSDEPYTPTLTLNPEPWNPEQANTEENRNA